MQILLHICCAPCALYPLRILRSAGYSVTGYFFNHNIHPYREYVLRRDGVVQMAAAEGLPLVMDDTYDLEGFLANVANDPSRRCAYCYASRLKATALKTVELGFDIFTASLLYSRYQQHDTIRVMGESLALELGVAFHYVDFRTGWQEGIRRSKEMGLYRQQYCGCIYSEKERYL